MFKRLQTKRAIGVILTLALCVGILVGCGGGKSGIPNGKYESDGSGVFTYLDFKGSNVEVGTGFGNTTISSETVKYTFKNGTLSFEIAGFPYEMPCAVDGNVLTVAGSKYYKGGVPADTSQGSGAETTPEQPEATPVAAVGSSEFDGEYVGNSGYSKLTLTITNGAFAFSGAASASGTVNQDGSFEASLSYLKYKFVHERDSFYTEDFGGMELVLVGGKPLFEYTIEEQTSGLPSITLKHEYDDTPMLIRDNVEIVDGVLYRRSSVVSEDPILSTAKRLFWNDSSSYPTYFFIDKNNDLWALGLNDRGQLGDGTGVDRDNPVKILGNVVDVVVLGAREVYAFTSDNSVYRWGLINNENVYAPELYRSDIAELYTGSYQLALKTNGDLVVLTSDGEKLIISKVKRFYVGSDGGAFVVFSDDSLFYYPNLMSVATSNATPQVSTAEREMLFNNADIYAEFKSNNGLNSGFGIWTVGKTWIVQTNDGALYGKGANGQGQLGDGTKIDREDWVEIAKGVSYYGIEDVTNRSATYYYVKTDGTTWFWTTDDPTQRQLIAETPEVESETDAESDSQAES